MRTSRCSLALLVALVSAAFTLSLRSQGLDVVKARYTKQEVYVTMRDGVRLFTAICTRKDRSTRYPIMLNRTPYSVAPYRLGPVRLFQRNLYTALGGVNPEKDA